MTPAAIAEIAKEAEMLPALAKQVIESSKKVVEEIAGHYSKLGCFLFLGRGVNYPTAMEGALKLKELSYIPAEGYAAGEMKHGPIALIDEYRAVVCVALHDALYEKMFSNIQEIKARKGRVLALVTEGDTKVKDLADECIELPKVREELSPLLAVIPLQFLAYDIARNLGYDIDKPRNLAKSVTVE
jgi:glucosamine--fructose-6-phosphate aminotransferase (isomerizing)